MATGTRGIDETLATRTSLLGRVKDPDDANAWSEFDRQYRRLIMAIARHHRMSREEAEDVTQETMASVAAALPGFEYRPGRCHFRTWLRTLLNRRIADHFRKKAQGILVFCPGELETSLSSIELRPVGPGMASLEEVWEAEWEQSILETAWNRLRQAVKPLAFQVLHLRLCEERSFPDIAQALGLSLNAVYLGRIRAGRVFQRLIREARREQDFRDAQVIRAALDLNVAKKTAPDRKAVLSASGSA